MTQVPKHLKPRIKRHLGTKVLGVPIPMWECKLGNESAVASTPYEAWKLFVYGLDGFTTMDRVRNLGLD